MADSPGNGPPPLPFLLWETSSEDTQGIFQGPSLYHLKLFWEVANGSMALIGESQILSLKKSGSGKSEDIEPGELLDLSDVTRELARKKED